MDKLNSETTACIDEIEASVYKKVKPLLQHFKM